MRAHVRILLLALACASGACGQPTSPTLTTGLTGVVVRGPIAPVCQIQLPCEAPFSASFSVERGGRRIAQFRSDADGRFTVTLPPGVYYVVPSADAPILRPQLQAKTVEVPPVGLKEIRLEFDTGIR